MLRKIYAALEATIVTMGRPVGGCGFCSQPRPRRLARQARRRPRWHRGKGAGLGALPGLARRLFGRRPRLHPGPARALPPAGACPRLLARHGLQGDRARPAGQQPRCRHGRRHLLLPGHARSPRRRQRRQRAGTIDDDVHSTHLGSGFMAAGAQGRARRRRLRALRLPGPR